MTRHAARGTRHLLVAAMLTLMAIPVAGQTPAPTSTQVPDASQFVGPPEGQPLRGEALERRTNEVGGLLRCPVCQGLSVADSPAEMAVNMKGQVRDLLSRGYTEEQILRYFEQSYGQFVLLRPKFEGVNALVWVLPVLALLVGGLIVLAKLKKLSAPEGAPATAVDAEPERAPESADDPYLAQVRDLVRGEKS